MIYYIGHISAQSSSLKLIVVVISIIVRIQIWSGTSHKSTRAEWMGKPTPIDEDVRLICVLTCSEGINKYMAQAFLISSRQRVIRIAISFVKCN